MSLSAVRVQSVVTEVRAAMATEVLVVTETVVRVAMATVASVVTVTVAKEDISARESTQSQGMQLHRSLLSQRRRFSSQSHTMKERLVPTDRPLVFFTGRWDTICRIIHIFMFDWNKHPRHII